MTSPMSYLFLCISLVLIGHMTDAWPLGAPEGACTAQKPTGHQSSPQTVDSLYTITVDTNTYNPGDTVRVTLSGEIGATTTDFKGFLLQARRTNGDTDSAIGTFVSPPTGTKLLTCHENTDSAWTHNSPDNKTTVAIDWTAPARSEGDIVFRATVVKGPKETYWNGVLSENVRYTGPTVQPTTKNAAGTIQPITILLAVATGFLSLLLWQKN